MKSRHVSLAASVLAGLFLLVRSAGQPQTAALPAVYSPQPYHMWNRLFRLFYVRSTPDGRSYGGDELDPYLWMETRYLLSGQSHHDAKKLMQQFLDQHAEQLVRDPLKRAMLQRDLWAVYDWLEKDYGQSKENRPEFRRLLGEIIRRLALSEDEIGKLPDNYRIALDAKEFPTEDDVNHREAAFLPDLFKPDGPWVCVGKSDDLPVASLHLSVFKGRSAFLVFLNLPGGRKETVAYLEKLRAVPSHWTTMAGFREGSGPRVRAPQPPQFPLGTKFTLVRQMVLLSETGKFIPAHITESVQLRVYRNIDPAVIGMNLSHFQEAQDVFEFRLDRQTLFAGKSGLRRLDAEEKDLPTFLSHGIDPFESSRPPYDLQPYGNVVLRSCVACHYDPGVQSFISHSRAHFDLPGLTSGAPPDLVESAPAREIELQMRWRPQHPELNSELLGQK